MGASVLSQVRWHALVLALIGSFMWAVSSSHADETVNVPPYSLSIINVIVRPNETQVNVAKGLYLKGGYVLTAFHVGEKVGDNTRYLSFTEAPMLESLQMVADKGLDFSILKLKDSTKAGRFIEYFGGFGSADLSIGDGVYYFINDAQSLVHNDVIRSRVLQPRNPGGRILITGGVPQGYSGSPVFSARTQRLIGMIVFGDEHMTELLPIEDVFSRVDQTSHGIVSAIQGTP